MNLLFWKKKKAPEESDNNPADETLVAKKTDPAPAKPGFWTRLKSTLLPSRKKDKTEGEEKPEGSISSAKRTDKKHPDEEPEPSAVPAEKPGKRLVIVLALLIPLAAGGGFFAAIKLLPPPQHQEAPPAKATASQEAQIDGHPAPEPTKALKQEPEQPAPQQADNATTPTAKVPEPTAEAPVADAPAPSDEDVQAQIQAMKKQNQEMQAQIEALKKQSAIARPARPAASAMPREGVLIINGKDTKASAQVLKKVIESMNAASGAKDAGKK
ncbi:MAG: hypothetical protein ACYDDT_03425 [Sulfuricella sp.]